MKYLFVVLAGLTISGCNSVQRVEPYPITGNKALLTVDIPKMQRDNILAMMFVNRYAHLDVVSGKDGCPWESAEKFKQSYLFSTKFNSDRISKQFEIPAGQDVYVTIMDDVNGSVCDQAVKFNPVEAADYRLDVTAHNSAFSRCSSVLKKCSGDLCEVVEGAHYAKPETMFMGTFSVSEICTASK